MSGVPDPKSESIFTFLIEIAEFVSGLLRALFFGEKCATCVQFVECAGVR